MLKANKIEALSMELAMGGQAVLIQDGPQWNNLTKFKCVSPAKLEGQTIIASLDRTNSPLVAAFGTMFNMNDGERWVAVMASPELIAHLKKDVKP